LIPQTRSLLDEQEQTFFRFVTDEELGRIIIHLRLQLNEVGYTLIKA
jgi:hypothetical protein